MRQGRISWCVCEESLYFLPGLLPANSPASRFDSVVLLLLVFLVQIYNIGFKNKQPPKTTATKPYRFFQTYILDKKSMCWNALEFYGMYFTITLSDTLCFQMSCKCTTDFMPSKMAYNCSSKNEVLKTLLVSVTTTKTDWIAWRL